MSDVDDDDDDDDDDNGGGDVAPYRDPVVSADSVGGACARTGAALAASAQRCGQRDARRHDGGTAPRAHRSSVLHVTWDERMNYDVQLDDDHSRESSDERARANTLGIAEMADRFGTFERCYELGDVLGAGTYGTVRLVTLRAEYARHLIAQHGVSRRAVHAEQQYAVKILEHDANFWHSFPFLREMDALMSTRSMAGTVDVHDCVFDDQRGRAYVVMDRYEGTLVQYVRTTPSDERVRHWPIIATQLLLTLAQLHATGIAHRDLKPSNVLVQHTAVARGCPVQPVATSSMAHSASASGSDGGDGADSMALVAPWIGRWHERSFGGGASAPDERYGASTAAAWAAAAAAHRHNAARGARGGAIESDEPPHDGGEPLVATSQDGQLYDAHAGDLALSGAAPLVVLCDFGLAKRLAPQRDTPCLVTLNYRPPEMFFESQFDYTTTVDVWSIGCVLFEVLTGSRLFDGKSEARVLHNILQYAPESDIPDEWRRRRDCPFPPPLRARIAARTEAQADTRRGGGASGGGTGSAPRAQVGFRARLAACLASPHRQRTVSEPMCALLEAMLSYDPLRRPSASELLQHPAIAPYVARVRRFVRTVQRQRPTTVAARSATLSGGDRHDVAAAHDDAIESARALRMLTTLRWAFRGGVDVRADVACGACVLERAPHIDATWRSCVADWLWTENASRRNHPSPAITALHMLDRYVAHVDVHTAHTRLDQRAYVLTAAACLYVALAYYEPQVVHFDTLVASAERSSGATPAYGRREAHGAIMRVLHTLRFQISAPTPWTLYINHRHTLWSPVRMSRLARTTTSARVSAALAETPRSVDDARVARALYVAMRDADALPNGLLVQRVASRACCNRELSVSMNLAGGIVLRHVERPPTPPLPYVAADSLTCGSSSAAAAAAAAALAARHNDRSTAPPRPALTRPHRRRTATRTVAEARTASSRSPAPRRSGRR